MRAEIQGVEDLLKRLVEIGGRKAPKLLVASINAAGREARKLAKAATPRQTGRKGRGKRANGSKRLSQTIKLTYSQRGGRARATVSWAGQANFLNYGALKYRRRKNLVRKDGKPSKGKLPRAGMTNQHNSRKSKRKGWANQFWRASKARISDQFVAQVEKRISTLGSKSQ